MGYGHAHTLTMSGAAGRLDLFDPAVRENLEFRKALAARDIPHVYQLLCRMGYSQRAISQLAKQAQSEVSEIFKGRRVRSYVLLVRIADGFGIPHGWMGLASDVTTTTAAQLGQADDNTEPEEPEAVKRRDYFIATGAVLFGPGNAVFGSAKPMVAPPPVRAPLPAVVTRREVRALRALTAQLRTLGRAGNGGMPDVLTPTVIDAERHLRVDVDSDATARSLRSALAELHTLAGWCAHDMHLTVTARWHYSRATTLAGEADDITEAVSATWHASIMERDRDPDTALKLLQLAQARGSGIITPAIEATLCVSSARVWSIMGRDEDVHRYLARARDLPVPKNAIRPRGPRQCPRPVLPSAGQPRPGPPLRRAFRHYLGPRRQT